MNTAPRIQLRGVTKQFGFGDTEHYALNRVDLTVQKGEFIAIMGPSGCGKTTLLNVIGLLDQATDGEYYLDEKAVDNLSSRRHAKIRSRQIGFIFQNFNLIPRLTVIDNVALPGHLIAHKVHWCSPCKDAIGHHPWAQLWTGRRPWSGKPQLMTISGRSASV